MAKNARLAPAATTAAGGVSYVTSKDGTRIAYERTGSGPPLIMVAGALGSKGISFSKQYAAELAKHFTVYNYDRRGRGDSADTPPYSVQREIEDLAALAKEAGGRPFVFGLSSGAALALQAAAAGVPIARLVAYEPPYMLADAKDPPAPDFEQRLKQFAAEDRRDEAVTYFMRTVGVPSFGVFIMKRFPFWKDLRAVAHTLPYDAAVMAGFSIPERILATIRVPTLVATGSKSPKNLQESAAAVAKLIPGAGFRVLPKMNHGVKPRVIAPVIRDYCVRAAAPLSATANGRGR